MDTLLASFRSFRYKVSGIGWAARDWYYYILCDVEDVSIYRNSLFAALGCDVDYYDYGIAYDDPHLAPDYCSDEFDF